MSNLDVINQSVKECSRMHEQPAASGKHNSLDSNSIKPPKLGKRSNSYFFVAVPALRNMVGSHSSVVIAILTSLMLKQTSPQSGYSHEILDSL